MRTTSPYSHNLRYSFYKIRLHTIWFNATNNSIRCGHNHLVTERDWYHGKIFKNLKKKKRERKSNIEAHAVAQMNNANIVNIYDSGEESVVNEHGMTE